jgi:hypothetical protein
MSDTKPVFAVSDPPNEPCTLTFRVAREIVEQNTDWSDHVQFCFRRIDETTVELWVRSVDGPDRAMIR